MSDMLKYANEQRDHFYSPIETAKVNRYIRLTANYLNLFLDESDKVIDVGASDGEMKKYLDANYTGIDIDPASDFVIKKSADEIEGFYDMAIFNHTLEHMQNTHFIIEHISKHLIGKKLIYIGVPLGEWSWSCASHIVMFNESILNKILAIYGFEIIEQFKLCFREDRSELWTVAKLLH